jgi:hypothetical protein
MKQEKTKRALERNTLMRVLLWRIERKRLYYTEDRRDDLYSTTPYRMLASFGVEG